MCHVSSDTIIGVTHTIGQQQETNASPAAAATAAAAAEDDMALTFSRADIAVLLAQ
jgi:hypothetical protein